eukprot:13536772-Ditylum_brightwellii.AAC.1
MKALSLGFAKKVDFEQELSNDLDLVELSNDGQKKDQAIDDKKDLNAHSWTILSRNFSINEEAEYIGGADSEIIKITACRNNGDEFNYVVVGNSGVFVVFQRSDDRTVCEDC